MMSGQELFLSVKTKFHNDSAVSLHCPHCGTGIFVERIPGFERTQEQKDAIGRASAAAWKSRQDIIKRANERGLTDLSVPPRSTSDAARCLRLLRQSYGHATGDWPTASTFDPWEKHQITGEILRRTIFGGATPTPIEEMGGDERRAWLAIFPNLRARLSS